MNPDGMTIGTMLGQSTRLMLMGMATVFSFITIMIIALGLVHKFLHALKLDVDVQAGAVPVAPAAAHPVVTQTAPGAGRDGAIIAAIAAAIHAK